MKALLTALLMAIAFCETRADVYVIIYATSNGRTGHAGIAIDRYQIIVRNDRADTVKTHALTYFDVWPTRDEFRLFDFAKNQEAIFYKLPNSIWPANITLQSLFDEGIPHREHYAADAILTIKTKPATDYALITKLDQVMETKPTFNPRFYNCSDFTLNAVNFVTGENTKAKEFIPFSLATTPNKLYRVLAKRPDVSVVKKAPNVISRSFFRERILKRRATHQRHAPALAHK